MRHTIARANGTGKYQRPDRALEVYVAMGGSRSVAGAHAKEGRIKDDALKLVRAYIRAGSHARALTFIEFLLRETDRAPIQPLNVALKEDGHAGRAQDEAVEAVVIDGATEGELDLLITRSTRQVTALQGVCRSARAELAKLRAAR